MSVGASCWIRLGGCLGPVNPRRPRSAASKAASQALSQRFLPRCANLLQQHREAPPGLSSIGDGSSPCSVTKYRDVSTKEE